MPPNMSTAVFDTTSARVRPPARFAAGGDDRRAGVAVEHRFDARAQRRERAPAGRRNRVADDDARNRVYDRVIPAEDRGRVRALETERVGGDGRCQRTRQATPQLRAPIGLNRVDQPLRLRLDERGEALSHHVGAELCRERIAVAGVRGTVAREHARPHDPPGGETGIVDRERRRGAHRLQREIAPRDEPAPERGQPRHRLALAQPRGQRLRIEVELLEACSSAYRKRDPSTPYLFSHTV